MTTRCEDHRQENPTLEESLCGHATFHLPGGHQEGISECRPRLLVAHPQPHGCIGVPSKPISIVDRLPSRAKFVIRLPTGTSDEYELQRGGKVALRLPRAASPRRSATERHLCRLRYCRPSCLGVPSELVLFFCFVSDDSLSSRSLLLSLFVASRDQRRAASASRSPQVFLWDPGEPLWRCSSPEQEKGARGLGMEILLKNNARERHSRARDGFETTALSIQPTRLTIHHRSQLFLFDKAV